MALTAEIWVRRGVVARLQVDGHAGFGAEQGDPVCAGVSILARSAARLLARLPDVRVAGQASRSGSLAFEVEGYDGDAEDRLRGITSLLLQGLRDLADEAGFELREHEEQ